MGLPVLKDSDMKLFIKMIAERQWRNGHLVLHARKFLATGKLDESMMEPKFLKAPAQAQLGFKSV